MFRKLIVLAALAAFVTAPVQAATAVGYTGNANQLIPVASSTPLPVSLTTGGVSSVPVNLVGGTINASMTAFVNQAGVATAAVVDSVGRAFGNVSTGTVAIANGLAVETGLTSVFYSAVATNALTLLSTFASGTTVPYWISVQNVGGVNLVKQVPGATVSDNALYIPIGDTLTWYVATNTPALGLHAPTTGAVGAVAVEITK